MNKIVLFLILLVSFSNSEISEYKSDVYFANGINTKSEDADLAILEIKDSFKFSNPSSFNLVQNWTVSLNNTHGIGIDIYESFLQKIDETLSSSVTWEVMDWFDYTFKGLLKKVALGVAKKQIKEGAKDWAKITSRKVILKLADKYGKIVIKGKAFYEKELNAMLTILFEELVDLAIDEYLSVKEDDIREDTENDTKTQFEAYIKSIKDGHGVVVIAHSQGNLFTNLAYDMFEDHWFPWDEDTAWMAKYFSAYAVASPANDILGKKEPHITFDNDPIYLVPDSLNWNIKHPNKKICEVKNGAGERIVIPWCMKSHSFLRSYMATDITRGKILDFINEKVILQQDLTKRPSQWKPKKLGCTCKKKYAKMTHAHDPDSMDKYLKNHKVKDFVEGKAGKIYVAKKKGAEVYVRATYGGANIEEVDEENSDVCYALKDDAEDASTIGEIEGAKTPQVIAQDGAIEVTINWSHMCDINMDLTLEGNNVIQDVKDVENLSFEHAYVASKAQIYPNTTYTAYAYGNKKENSGLEEEELEDDPVIIHAVVKTPSNSRFAVYEAKDYESLNLKRFAWIEIKKDKSTSSGTSSGGGSGGGSSGGSGGGGGTRPYDECRDSDKKHTCACVPCEYIIKGFKNSVELGPIADAEVEIISADTYGSNVPNVVYRGKTTSHSSIFKTGLVKFNQSDYSNFEDDAYYVVSAKGGEDVDRDDDFIRDITPTQNNGTLHAIIKGSDLKLVAFRVNALTEAIYQVSGELLGVGYDTKALDEKLDDAAKRLFTKKTFVFNNEVDINYHDVLLWVPAVDKRILFKPYDIFVEPIVVKIYADEPRIKESYKLIYEKLDTDAPQLRPLALEIPHTIPTNSIVGKVNIVSEGVNGIDHIELHGDENSSFSIDKEGLIKVVESSGFIIDALYKLDMIAVGTGGKRSISMELIVKVIEGTPLADPNATVPTLESIELFDIVENSPSGTVVGQANFIDSNLSIVEHKISGEDNVSFSIDDSGEITIANGAEIDYEKSDTYSISISAVNEAGNESFPIKLSIGIINEIDTPLFDLVYLLNINENIAIGTIIGKIEQSREGRSPIRSFDILNPNVPFGIDVNGTIRTTKYINYEDEDEYNLIAIARTDSGDSNKVDLQIFVKDIEPEVGKPSLQEFTVTIDENTSEGTEIGVLDVNQGASSVGLIELRGVGNSHFRVDNNGTITVAQKVILDYEQKNTYTLQAIAHNANGSSDLVSVHIILNNVVDEQPSLYRFTNSVDENTSSNTVVGKLKIRSMGDGTITDYTLTGIGAENFTIDENGTIRVSSSATLDYETTPRYTLQATVLSDAGESAPSTVRIYILNVPEYVPVLKPLTLSIEENASIGTVVGTVQEDVGGDSPIVSYMLDDNSTFSIDANGTLHVVGTLDYETQTSHTLQVRASNGAGTSNPVSVTVNIINIIDDEPVLNDANFTVLENIATGTVVGIVEVNSTGTSAITGMRLEGIGAENFSIDANGTVRVVGAIDYESKKVYHLRAIATNAKADSPEADVTIEVENVAEIPPVVYAFRGYIEENATVGTTVGKVQLASIGDSPVTAYELNGTKATDFSIDSNGSITVSATAQLSEATHKIYALQVRAKNTVGFSDYVNVSITVTYDKAVPFKPSNLELLDIGHNSITIGWRDNAQNERGFNLYVDGVLNATLDINTTSYRVIGLTEETTYIFTLKSFNDRGESIGASMEAITDIDRSEYLKAVLTQKCGISENNFEAYFNRDTGYYSQSITCYKTLTDEDIVNFKALKSVGGNLNIYYNSALTNLDGLSNLRRVGGTLNLYNNNLTNLDGLSNLESVRYDMNLQKNKLTNINGLAKLKSVGRSLYLNNNSLSNIDGLSSLESVGTQFHLESNQLTHVNGLSSLRSVGNLFYLQDNLLDNVDGLSALQTVGSHFYLYNNQLVNIDGLTSLSSVGGNFHISGNQVTNLDSLTNLTSVGGYVALYNNANLVDVSGIENVTGSPTKLLYITPEQYSVKADVNSSMCSTSWDLRDSDGDIVDDMNYVCEGQDPYVVSDIDKLKAVLESKCNISLSNFNSYFNRDTGHYNNTISCYNTLTDEDIVNFKALKSVRWSLNIYNNSTLTNLDGLSNLRSVDSLYIARNSNLANINGLSSLISVNSVNISENANLTNLDGLGKLESVRYDMNLQKNKLTNINGLAKLKSVGRSLYLNNNSLSNIDGLSSLESVGTQFHLESNQLTHVNGLSSLRSVGNLFYLQDNLLDNVDGLSALQTVGSHFYLYNNQLVNIDGLTSLSSVGGNFHISGNQVTNLDSLTNLTSVGGYVALYNNANLVDVSGIENVTGSAGKVMYITPNQYSTKAHYTSKLCAATWDLKDIDGDIDDNMTQVCSVDGTFNEYQALKTIMEQKCSVTSTQFASRFDEATGVYDTSLDCAYQELTDEDLSKFTILNEIQGSFSINDNNLTNLDGLSNLSSIGGYFYLYNNNITDISGLSSLTTVNGLFNISYNQMFNLDGLASLTTVQGIVKMYHNTNLDDISGLTNLVGVDGKKIYIDNTGYAVKADSVGSLCASRWDLYSTTGNIADDMRTLCDGYTYVASDADRLRDVLGKRCKIDSLTFYSNFVESTGTYNGNINCTALKDVEMSGFAGLLEVNGNFTVEDSNITTVEELIRLKSVTGTVSIQCNFK